MPNSNAYLALALPDATRRALQALTSRLEAQVRLSGGEFKAMDGDALHMTFLFCGEQLSGREMPASSLVAWHATLCRAVQDFIGSAKLKVQRLELFPPGKQNLVVATFEASHSMHRLQHELEKLSAAAGLHMSDSVRRQENEQQGDITWIPHVTLGKLRTKKNGLQSRISVNLHSGHLNLHSDLNFHAPKIILCGRIPQQAWLDWDHALVFANDSSESDNNSDISSDDSSSSGSSSGSDSSSDSGSGSDSSSSGSGSGSDSSGSSSSSRVGSSNN